MSDTKEIFANKILQKILFYMWLRYDWDYIIKILFQLAQRSGKISTEKKPSPSQKRF